MSRFDRLSLLATFVRTAERGSLTAAARDLGTSQPSVTRQLNELERRLAVQLMHRTTHGLALTEDGRALLADARAMLAAWDGIEERAAPSEDVSGSIRVVAPIALGQRHLIEGVLAFQRDHPDVSIVWHLTDRPIRFDEEGCDCWFRVGPVPDDTLVVRTLGLVERMVVATPAYANHIGSDLAALPWITLTPYEGERVRLWDEGGAEHTVEAVSRMATNNIFAQWQAVMDGMGLAVMPRWFIEPELGEGRVVDMAPTLRAERLPINIATSSTRARPNRVDLFIEAMSEWVRVNVEMFPA